MLSLPWAIRIRENDSQIFPEAMSGNSLLDIASDSLGHVIEKGSAGSDQVGVKALLVDVALDFLDLLTVDVVLLELVQKILFFTFDFLSFHGSSEAPGSLLVHLGSGGDAINGEV
jgi:hypothetical protein